MPAMAQTCSHVDITVLPFEVTEDYGKSYLELQDIGGGDGEVGLVRTISSVSARGCAATIGYREPTLYVATELRRDRCAFEHVKEHEFEHVRIYREHLEGIAGRIERRVAAGQALFDAAADEVLAVSIKHQAFDSPDKYSGNRTECKGKIIKLALNRR